MASTMGLANEWDSCAGLRERMRKKKSLFLSETGKANPVATVACCSVNLDVLKPLAQRLEDPEKPGTLLMFKVPDLIKENLACMFMLQCIFGFHFLKVLYLKIAVTGSSQKYEIWLGLFLVGCLPAPRIRAFYEKFKVQIPCPPKKELKREAKVAKACMVLVKRKLQREQVCRDSGFRTLMAVVFKDGTPFDLQERLCFVFFHFLFDVYQKLKFWLIFLLLAQIVL